MNDSGLQLTKEEQYFIPGSSDVKKLRIHSSFLEASSSSLLTWHPAVYVE